METLIKGIAALVGFVLILFVVGGLSAIVTLWLVNYLFSAAFLTFVFGISALTFGKAWALNIVAGLLFKTSVTSK